MPLDLVDETRQFLTPEEINERCYVDINSNKAVFESLSNNNPKVRFDGSLAGDFPTRNQLIQLIREFPKGISVIDLKDPYPTVMEDLQALKASGSIWLLSNFDSKEDIAYPNDHKVQCMKVDEDIKKLFHEIELRCDMFDIEKELLENEMKPATNTTARRLLPRFKALSLNKRMRRRHPRSARGIKR